MTVELIYVSDPGEQPLHLAWMKRFHELNPDITIQGSLLPEDADLYSKLLAMVSDGKQGWLRLVQPDGRIHGRVNPNGACTGRMSHSKPNMAQVPKDPRARALFLPRPGWKLVGCDAEGLEARMLAHYLALFTGRAAWLYREDTRTA